MKRILSRKVRRNKEKIKKKDLKVKIKRSKSKGKNNNKCKTAIEIFWKNEMNDYINYGSF